MSAFIVSADPGGKHPMERIVQIPIHSCDIDSMRFALKLINQARDKQPEHPSLWDAAAINLDRIIEDFNAWPVQDGAK
jgi:hypothetical protein